MNQQRAIDWNQVRSTLQAQVANWDRRERSSAEDVQAIHSRRAAALRKRTAGPTFSQAWPALVFEIGRENYGLPLASLAEVIPQASVTAVPGGPPELCGLASIRGDICSVVDLPLLLGIAKQQESSPAYLVVLRHPTVLAGLWVDALIGVEFIQPESLEKIEGHATGNLNTLSRTAKHTLVLESETLFSRLLVEHACSTTP